VQKEIYNKAIEEYNKLPWTNKKPTFINSTINGRKVVLRDDENKNHYYGSIQWSMD